MANKANDSFNKKLLQIVGNEETAAKVLELIEEHKQQERGAPPYADEGH